MNMSPEHCTKGLAVDGQPFTVAVTPPHIWNKHVAKFARAELVELTENAPHVIVFGVTVGFEVDPRTVGRLVCGGTTIKGENVGERVGPLVGGDGLGFRVGSLVGLKVGRWVGFLVGMFSCLPVEINKRGIEFIGGLLPSDK
jgi:hypothetical protein